MKIQSVKYAINGIRHALKTQWSMRFHLVASMVVLAAGLYFNLSAVEWCLILFAIGAVWSAELLNTAIEYTVDICSPEWSVAAGKAKDVAAGGVLMISFLAAVIGCIIFIPKLIACF